MDKRIRQILEDPEQIFELKEKEIALLIERALVVLRREEPLVHFNNVNTLLVGDTHGDLESTISIIKRFLDRGYEHIVFLGDYVDRGSHQIENINYILCLKLVHPKRVILLRGNHETPETNSRYGFLDVVMSRLTQESYSSYNNLFSHLPYSCLIDKRVLCLHGGLATQLSDIDQLKRIPRQVKITDPLTYEILWNDPDDNVKGFAESDRGSKIFCFGQDVFNEFAEKNGIDLLIRGHQVFPKGYRFLFDNRILSIFSAKNYTRPIDAKVAELDENGDLRLVPVDEN
ncbi:MAG: metallophosphoesterase [Candidatus Hodarchaeota archaeon]